MKHLILMAALVAPAAFAQATPPANAEVIRARVVKVDAPRGKVTLNHAPIKSIQMEAMTMPFKVKDADMLGKIKPGDQVRFSVALQDDELLITRIEAVK
jgi:Cu(I)/Ag(I) efflux system periplasmic protein CusF